MASCAARASNYQKTCSATRTQILHFVYLVGGRAKFEPSQVRYLGCHLHVESLLCVETLEHGDENPFSKHILSAYCAYGGPPLGKKAQARQRGLYPFDTVGDLLSISTEFLAERKRGRVLGGDGIKSQKPDVHLK
jgi:hypothetical protein